jgi:dephospho-CoA kinase
MIIGITGRKGVGKDTLADYLVSNYGFIKLSMADPLKKAVMEMFSLTYDQVYGDYIAKETPDSRWFNASPRQILQYIGTDLFRNQLNEIMPGINKNVHVIAMKNKIASIREKNPSANIVIADIRFDNEIEISNIIIKLTRNIETDNNTQMHESEAGICDSLCSVVWNNNSNKQMLYECFDAYYSSIQK